MRSNISAVRAFLLAGLGLALLSAVQGTQSMVRPKNYKEAPNPLPPVGDLTPHVIHKRATGKVNVAYFTNWGIYGANFQPTDIVPGDLTHVLYSFADSSADTGAIVFPTDSYADQEKHFPTDSWNDVGNNLYGCVKQLYLLKLANRNLKVVLSVGGWTYTNTDRHMDFVTDATKRATFVSSAVQLIKDYGFDGIDLDYEFPSNTAQGQGFADLITELRAALTSLMQSNGDSVPYQISAAVSAGSANYAFLVIPQMNAALDYFNLMAYDYSGSFSNITANQANVYGPSLTGFDTDSAVKWYLASGASASKMNLGMPLYGHAFEATAGLGAPYNGIGPGSNNNPGIYAYKDLLLAGATVFENMTDVSSYSYDASKQEFVSHDTPDIIKAKVAYAQSKGFVGSMFWELSTDKVGSLSLVGTSHTALGGLDTTQNHINYPDSKWDNIRSNMGATTGTTTTSAATSTTTDSTGTGTGACASVAAWSSTSIYTAGMTATFSGALWTAQWWTQGDTPGGSAGVWVKGAAC